MPDCRCCRAIQTIILGVVVMLWHGAVQADPEHRLRYGLGTAPAAERLAEWDIAIGPAGAELPPGRGDVATGQHVYAQKCAACHGPNGHEGPDPVLVGGRDTLASAEPLLTVGSFWRYATTLYDYINRAMPFFAPGSLTADEVYALCAYLLHANAVIDADSVMDRSTLPQVRMPNRDGFVPDARPDTSVPVNAGATPSSVPTTID